jgi:ATP-dependent DNA helicase RecQ
LQAAEHGWGPLNTVWILRGDARAPDSSRQEPYFGALDARSQGAIRWMLDSLLEEGVLMKRTLDHGGTVIMLSPKGHRAQADPSLVLGLASLGATQPRAEPALDCEQDAPLTQEQEGTFQRLRAWRWERARRDEVPAFIVAHNSVLRSIAMARPESLDDLAEVKGIGPVKLERYGEEILGVVQGESRSGPSGGR